MRFVEETDGGNPTRGLLVSLNEILGVEPDNPRRARSADWLCDNCRKQVALLFGLCGGCWLEEWKAAQP
jgi:hypothetical protein